jgi:hypothetical protein
MEDGPNPSLRYDIEHKSTPEPRPPANCPLSYGYAFGLNPTGAGLLVCHGDTLKDADDVVIAYGHWRHAYGFTCASQTTGVRCVNAQHHGFSLVRVSQKVF